MRGAKQKEIFEISSLVRLSVCPPGGGGAWIFSIFHTCIYRLRMFFLVQNFEFQYFLGGFRKLNIFGDMKILWIFFGGLSQNWTIIFRGHFYAF